MSRGVLTPHVDAPIDWVDPINWLHPLNAGLAAWWLCAPGTTGGRTLLDMCRRANGTLVGMDLPSCWRGRSTGHTGSGALNFDGTDDHVVARDINESTTTLSVFCWMKSSVAASGTVFAGHYQTSTTNRSWLLGKANTTWTGPPGGDELAVILSTDGTLDSGKFKAYWVDTNICDGVWHRVGFTWNIGTLSLYIDGTARTTTKQNDDTFTTILNSTSQLSLGAVNPDSTPVLFHTGQLDDVRIWNRVLRPTEIYHDYLLSQQGNPGLLNRVRLRYAMQAAAAAATFVKLAGYRQSLAGVGGGLAG